MKKSMLFILFSSVTLTGWLCACATTAAPTMTPKPIIIATDTVKVIPTITTTNTPDVCAPENIETEVDKVHRHMREFDDASTLAASLSREQLSGPIADLQKIRRDAEDEVVPPCLSTLKNLQIKHMNSVISTLIAFLSVGDPRAIDCANGESNPNEEMICQSIASARDAHDQYTLELARVLGIPIVTATPVDSTPQP